MIYHLYQRSITYKGKKIKAWYYWYYDDAGKQIRKTCGIHGPCTLKREAQAFIEKLPDPDKIKKAITFNQFCEHMFDDNSPYLIKRKNKGIDYKPQTLYQHRLYLGKFLAQFGTLEVNELQVFDIDNWLLTLDLSNSVKNSIITVIKEIYSELYVYHLIPQIPLIQMYKRNDTKLKGILTQREIKYLFPDDYNELLKIWHTKGSSEIDTYMFATMIFLIISTGMRNCEARAIFYNQLVQRDALLINAMIDSEDERTNVLKKGDVGNKKWRVVILPEKTARMLDNLIQMNTSNLSDYIFTYKGEPMTTDYLRNHFRRVLMNNNIDWKKRNIGIHSLRFTYDTMMKPEISGNDLRLMIGHVSPQMTDYYDRSQALEHLPALLLNKSKIDSIFN